MRRPEERVGRRPPKLPPMNGVTNQSARAGAAVSSTQSRQRAAIDVLVTHRNLRLLPHESCEPSPTDCPAAGDRDTGTRRDKGTSLPSTPSPSCALIPVLNDGVSGVAPAIARIAMSVTSSPTRRPFGKPAASPPARRTGWATADGGIATLNRSISDGVTSGADSARDPLQEDRHQSSRGAGGRLRRRRAA